MVHNVKNHWGIFPALMLVLAGCSADEDALEGKRVPLREIARAQVELADRDPALLPPVAITVAWAQVGGNAARAGLHPDLSASLRLAWQYSTGAAAEEDWRYVAEPVVVDGKVLVLDAKGVVHAVGGRDGNGVWRQSVVPAGEEEDEAVGGGLAVGGTRLFVTTGFGEVLALRLADGGIDWRVRLDAPIRAAPAYSRGRVATVLRNDELLVLDADTGAVMWRARGAGAGTSFLKGSGPAIRDGVLVAPFASGEVAGYDLADGRPRWTEILTGGARDTPLAAFSDVTAAPVMADERVFAGTRRGEFAAINWRTGGTDWRRQIAIGNRVWALGDSVYLLDAERNLMRLGIADGRAFWRRPLPAYEDPDDREEPIFYGGPVVADRRVLLVSSTGGLEIHDAATGAPVQSIDLGAAATSVPVVAAATLFVFRDDGVLIALR